MSQPAVEPLVLTETHPVARGGVVRLIRLNRPKALNALSDPLTGALSAAFAEAEADPEVRVIVLTGSERAFAAGADIREMKDRGFAQAYLEDFVTKTWEAPAHARKPVIAAVAGYALGGGCELAMMCDIVLAADTAKFGQPEITLGILPGAGGTQRLTRLIGRARAMDLILTGRTIDAAEAERIGLVSRVVPAASLIEEALKTAQTIAGFSMMATLLAKEAIKRADETTLAEGLRFERRMFHASFELHDKREGMAAFLEKRAATFEDR